MNADVVHALTALDHAARVLADVASLPAEQGARVRWSNGVVWRRVRGDEWQPEGDGIPTDYDEARAGAWTAPSAHIAAGDWTPEPKEQR